MLFFAEGFTFRNFLADAFAVFMFVVWFWLLIVVASDLFRRHDVSGWVKAILGHRPDCVSVPWHICVHDHPVERYGRAKQPASAAGSG